MVIPNISEAFSNIINWSYSHWYIFVIVGLGVGIVYLISQILKNKIQRHSEIKDHHDKIKKEMEFNKTPIKWIYQRGKRLGKVKGFKDVTIRNPITKKVKGKDGKIEDRIDIEIENYYLVSVANKGFSEFWVGEEHILLPHNIVKVNHEKSRLEVSNNVFLEYYLGYILPTEQKTKVFTYSDFHRTMMDKTVDGMGTQMLKFSEIRDIWAHELNVKDKELEKIKEEKRLAGMRSR